MMTDIEQDHDGVVFKEERDPDVHIYATFELVCGANLLSS